MYWMPFTLGILVAAMVGMLLFRPATCRAACAAPCDCTSQNDAALHHVPSKLDAATVRANVLTFLKEKNLPLFAEFDHAKNAASVQLSMPYSTVLVFGNPAVGTKLMQAHPDMALELPLKVLVWQDAKGQVWLSYHNLRHLARQHGMEDGNPVVQGMSTLLEALGKAATNK